jgi:hypothetical protein
MRNNASGIKSDGLFWLPSNTYLGKFSCIKITPKTTGYEKE